MKQFLKEMSTPEWVIIGTIIALMSFLVFSCYYIERYKATVTMPAAYQAWVKQTGNPKELTYEEWRSLMRANERQNDTTVIFMPSGR